MNGKWGSAIECSGNSRLTEGEILGLNIGLRGNISSMAYHQGQGAGICSTTELEWVQGL